MIGYIQLLSILYRVFRSITGWKPFLYNQLHNVEHIYSSPPCLVSSARTVSSWKSELFISPKGNDTQSCGERNDPCQTVDYVYDMLSPSGFNSTVLLLDKGEYRLRKSLTFKKVKNFTISERIRRICVEC